jgi:TonB family protein
MLRMMCLAGLLAFWSMAAPAGQAPTPAPLRVVGLEYPRLANLAHVEGKVQLRAEVTDRGDVSAVEVVSGHPLLANAVRQTMMKWKYASCAGTAPCAVSIVFLFELTEPCDRADCGTEFQVDLPDRVTVRARRLPPMIN